MKHLFCVVCAMMILALGSFSFGASEAKADAKNKMESGKNACAADVEKFCGDKKGKPARELITCLKAHEAELSPACKNHAQQGPGHAMMPSSHAGVMTSPQPAPPVGTGTSAPTK